MALKKKAAEEGKRPSLRDFDILDKPLITEKSSIVGGDGSTVVFKVAKSASKSDIRAAVERVFDVQVKAVRTCNFLGKLKRTTRSIGRRASFKKAYVTLQPGQSIDIVEGL